LVKAAICFIKYIEPYVKNGFLTFYEAVIYDEVINMLRVLDIFKKKYVPSFGNLF